MPMTIKAFCPGSLAKDKHRYICDPAVADLHISGSFPLNDIPAILQTIAQTLPVKVQRYTRFWTTLSPA